MMADDNIPISLTPSGKVFLNHCSRYDTDTNGQGYEMHGCVFDEISLYNTCIYILAFHNVHVHGANILVLEQTK